MQRILSSVFGVSVHHVMGMTDVDDKIVKRAKAEGKSLRDIARTYEAGFQADMTDLGVRPPSTVTRVSEHIPEIIRYCETIISNGYGYAAKGSVYFDSAAFAQKRRTGRALLDRTLDADASSQQIAQDEELLAEKRRASDFALWKAVPKEETSWPSPWGSGRPGWHVECSAMSNSIFGNALDVHTGGIDLKFPHHENEISQCLAHHPDIQQWPHYFLHTGHLYIAGAKMSKSLKNFLSIRDFISSNSATRFRLFCLSVPYRTGVEYSEDRMKDAAALERKLRDFLQTLHGIIDGSLATVAGKWRTDEEGRLQQVLLQAQSAIRVALADDFDTPTSLQELASLISATNVYMLRPAPSPHLLLTVCAYMEWLLSTFGLSKLLPDQSANSSSVADRNAVDSLGTLLAQCLHITLAATFRATIRKTALAPGPISAELKLKAILKECDVIRDMTIPSLGYKLEDRPDYGWLVKPK